VIKFVSDLRQIDGFLKVLQFPLPIKTDRHDITEISLKVAVFWFCFGLGVQCDSDATDLRCRFQHRYSIAATTQSSLTIASENFRRKYHRTLSQQI
jgi:hypothetical protein